MGTEGRQGVGADVEGAGKAFGGGGAVVADQLFLASESKTVHQAVKNPPLALDLTEHSLHLGCVLHIQGEEQRRLQGCGELTNLRLETPLLIREVSDAQFSACCFELLGDPPGDRSIVGNTGNENLLAREIEKHRTG